MSDYWWGLLTIPLIVLLIAVTIAAAGSAWWLFDKVADGKFIHLQGEKGYIGSRTTVAAWIMTAPRAWSVELAKFCCITLSLGKGDSDRQSRYKNALQLEMMAEVKQQRSLTQLTQDDNDER